MLPDNLSPFWAVRNISQATNTFFKKDLEKDYYKVLGLLGKNFTPENLICFLVAKTTLEVQISVCPSQKPLSLSELCLLAKSQPISHYANQQ